MTDQQVTTLTDAVRAAVSNALPGFIATAFATEDITFNQAMADAVAKEFNYSADLGTYILSQNPYAALTQIERPKIPLDLDSESPLDGIWKKEEGPPDLLKAGVLKTHHSEDILPVGQPVPFGTMIPFGIITGKNDMYMEPHNIVKMLVLRYKLLNRQKQDPAFPDDPTKTVPSNAYLMVCYSGGDSG